MGKYDNLTPDQKAAKLLELKQKKLELLQGKFAHQEANRIEYFNSNIPLTDGTYLRANPKQQLILDGWENHNIRTFTYTGGNRTGKTTVGSIIAVCVMAGKWLWNNEPIRFNHKFPRKVLYVGQDWQSHVKEVVIPELHFWWPDNRPLEIRKNQNSVDAIWIDKITKSRLTVMSNKQDSDVFEGQKSDLVIYDEPPKRNIRIACKRGLVDRGGRELYCMTLLKEAWVNTDVINALDENGKPDRTVLNVTATMYDNVGYGIKESEIKEFSKSLTDAEKKARIDGIPSYMEGLVYPQYKRETHIKDRFEIPLDWPIDIAIDTHPRKPHSVLFIATTERNMKYCIHELRMHGNGTKLADQIIRIINWGKYRINRVICDPLSKSDGNEENTTYNRIAEVLARYDIFLETASKDKDTGILQVKDHLMSANKEPSLFFFDDLIYTIKEIEGYMWEKVEIDDVEKAQKIEDDMMENLYRLILLDTEYTPYYEYDDEDTDDSTTINEMTGY